MPRPPFKQPKRARVALTEHEASILLEGIPYLKGLTQDSTYKAGYSRIASKLALAMNRAGFAAFRKR